MNSRDNFSNDKKVEEPAQDAHTHHHVYSDNTIKSSALNENQKKPEELISGPKTFSEQQVTIGLNENEI
jgi:hypothetical protein